MESRPNARLDCLPAEIFDQICSYVGPPTVTKIASTCRNLYFACLTPLYRHPRLRSYQDLALFGRAVNEAASQRSKAAKLKWWKGEEVISIFDILDLDVTINCVADAVLLNGRPNAVLISSLLHIVVGHCPKVKISLSLTRCSCHLPPIPFLASTSFPNVISLKVYAGYYQEDNPVAVTGQNRTDANDHPDWHNSASSPIIHPRLRSHQISINKRSCSANTKFWEPFLNGEAFPDCRSIEIHHYWATPPIRRQGLSVGTDHIPVFPNEHGADNPLPPGSVGGLKKIDTLIFEAVPELSTKLLLGIFNSPGAKAENLKRLELRYCNLDYRALAKLCYRILPQLSHFSLLIRRRGCQTADHARDELENVDFEEEYISRGEVPPHLCPLIRDHGKNLANIELAAPFICRELFLTKPEISAITKIGVQTGRGGSNGHTENGIDTFALAQGITEFRKSEAERMRKERVEKVVMLARERLGIEASQPSSSSIFGSASNIPSDKESYEIRAVQDVEYEIGQELENRTRQIGRKFERTIVVWSGMCVAGDTWDEVKELASHDEEGITWKLINDAIGTASRHSKGYPAIEFPVEEVL